MAQEEKRTVRFSEQMSALRDELVRRLQEDFTPGEAAFVLADVVAAVCYGAGFDNERGLDEIMRVAKICFTARLKNEPLSH